MADGAEGGTVGFGIFALDPAGHPGMSGDDRTSDSPPEVTSLLRTMAAYGTLLPSMLGGVAMGVLNRDRQTIVGYGVPTFVERFFTITGVKLDVQGEENLWSTAPPSSSTTTATTSIPTSPSSSCIANWGSVAKKEIAGPLAPRCSGSCRTSRSSTGRARRRR